MSLAGHLAQGPLVGIPAGGTPARMEGEMGKKKNIKRLWVVMAHFSDRTWEICDFAVDLPDASTSYLVAHKMKRDIYLHLQSFECWHKEDFAVAEVTVKR